MPLNELLNKGKPFGLNSSVLIFVYTFFANYNQYICGSFVLCPCSVLNLNYILILGNYKYNSNNVLWNNSAIPTSHISSTCRN